MVDFSKNKLDDACCPILCSLTEKLLGTLRALDLSYNTGLTAVTATALAKCVQRTGGSKPSPVDPRGRARPGSNSIGWKPPGSLEFIDFTGCSVEGEVLEAGLNEVTRVAQPSHSPASPTC